LIHRIPGVRGAQAYLYEGPDGLAVIDPGYTGSHRAVLRFLTERGAEPRDLRWVFLTHHHFDHGATAAALCQATGAQLAIHVADAPYLQPPRPRELMTFWGMVDRLPTRLQAYVASCAFGEVRQLREGESVAGLTVIHAPGHTPGSIFLWAPAASAVFTGDVVNNERGIGTPPWNVNYRHRQAKASAQRLGDFDFEQAFFGHGPAITEHASQRIRAFLDTRSGLRPARRVER
jgi:glyoxylase-like metal-dependent hydrolase (beta-lactamase superfamily II)